MKIIIFMPILMLIVLLANSCAILTDKYYAPDGPGILVCSHPSGWAGPRNKIRYEMPGNSVVELRIAVDREHSGNHLLQVGFKIPDGYKLNIKSKQIEVFSVALESPMTLTEERIWGKDLVSGRGFGWKISDDLIGGDGIYYEIMISFDLRNLNEFEIRFPEYYLNGEKFQIPSTKFKKEEGSFVFPLAGGF
jgi:hypothetical protein